MSTPCVSYSNGLTIYELIETKPFKIQTRNSLKNIKNKTKYEVKKINEPSTILKILPCIFMKPMNTHKLQRIKREIHDSK